MNRCSERWCALTLDDGEVVDADGWEPVPAVEAPARRAEERLRPGDVLVRYTEDGAEVMHIKRIITGFLWQAETDDGQYWLDPRGVPPGWQLVARGAKTLEERGFGGDDE